MKIFIGIPTFDHHIHAWLVLRLMDWVKKYEIVFWPAVGLQPVDNARNYLVEEFLKSDCTHLMMIDADTIPPEEALDKLLKLNKDFASGLTPIINGGSHSITKYNAVDTQDQEIKPDTGIFQSRGVGASCLLIKREVLERIKKPWFRFIHQDDTGKECFVSEDIYFISKCLPIGIIPYVDSSVVCQHIKQAIF